MAEAARATADGKTLVQCTIGTCGSNPSMYANPGFDMGRDFTPVILTGAVRNVMTVRKDLPATSLQEVIALARAQPGKLNSALPASAARTISHPIAARPAGHRLDPCAVPRQRPGDHRYRGWAHRRVFDDLPSILPQIRSGGVRAVAVVSEARVPELPDVPTFAEAGVPGIVIDSWFGFLAPAGTPPAVVAALNAAFGKALADPAVRARMAEVGVIPLGGTPERMGEHIRSEVARWGTVIRENNIRAQ